MQYKTMNQLLTKIKPGLRNLRQWLSNRAIPQEITRIRIQKKSAILFLGHLGLGDHIIYNGLMRELANKADELWCPVKRHNIASVRYMLNDLSDQLVIFPVDNDIQANRIADFCEKLGVQVERNGLHSPSWHDDYALQFDKNFYEMANIPFAYRWDRFSIPYNPSQGPEHDLYLKVMPKKPYAFVHDDVSRNLCIDTKRISKHLNIVRPTPGLSNVLFHWRKVIENADEIHCISSSFSQFIDSILPPNHAPAYLHRYARLDGTWSTFKNFTILD